MKQLLYSLFKAKFKASPKRRTITKIKDAYLIEILDDFKLIAISTKK